MSVGAETSWKQRRVGERLGRYLLGRCIGAGGAAAVYMARLDGPRGFERLLALKLVHEHLLEDRDFVAMFLDEANLSVRLSHPNIVHTYELAHQGDLLFIAMEFLQGKPLSQVYRRAFERGRPLDYDLIAWLGARAAEALHSAHELRDDAGLPLKIVHRDVSPDNLFLTYDGQLKVLDFGIARAEGRLAHTELGHIKGKFRYMSPEYALGQHFDHTLDLFALGATLYEAALGSAAFVGADETQILERLVLGDFRDPRAIRSDFPEPLARSIRRALDGDAARRFATGAEMAAELDAQAALTAGQARQRMQALLHELFAQEIREETTHIAELRVLKVREAEEALTPSEERLSVLSRTGARRPRRGAVILAASSALLAMAGALALLSLRNNEGSASERSVSALPVPSPSAWPSEVWIDLVMQPALRDASVRVQGRSVLGRPARARVKRGTEALVVEVEAPGYLPVHLEVVPDRDQFLVVPLREVPPAPAASTPTPVPLVRPTVSRPLPRSPAEPRAPAARSADESGVIRDNPFGR